MISKNEIHAFQLLPTTVTSLAKKLNVSPAAASKITEKLIINNLATKHRNGKTMLIEKEKTTLAQKLEEIITIFPRLPLEKILTHTNLTLIASMNYPLTVEEQIERSRILQHDRYRAQRRHAKARPTAATC